MEETLIKKRFNSYKKHQIVFYGDILGFSNCMKDIANNDNYKDLSQNLKDCIFVNIDNIYNAQVYKLDEKNQSTGVNFIWLSDSFAFASDVSKWENLKSRLLNFISLLWACDFIFNGALAFGDLHNDKNIMGATFIKAVELQQNCHSPEIVVESSFFNELILNEQEMYVNEESKVCFDYVYALIQETVKNGREFSAFDCLYELCSVEIKKSNEEKVISKYKCMIKMVISAIEKIYEPSCELLEIKERFQKIC